MVNMLVPFVVDYYLLLFIVCIDNIDLVLLL